MLLKSSYFHYIKFRQKSANSTRDKNVGILDRKIMGLKDRVNFGSLGFIKTNKITRLSLKEGMNRKPVKFYFFLKVLHVLTRKTACFMKTYPYLLDPLFSYPKCPRFCL